MTPVLDGHAHVFGTVAEDPRGVDDLAPADRHARTADLLSTMASAGVAGAVLVALDPADDYVADAVHTHPGRFVGVAVASAVEQGRSSSDPVAAVRRRRARFPFQAFRTSWLGPAHQDPADSPMLPTWRLLAEEGIPLWSYLAPDQLPLLPGVLALVPELRVVLNHLGFTPHDMRVDGHGRPRFDDVLREGWLDTVLALSDHDTVHVMVSGQYALSAEPPPYGDLTATIRRLVGAYGAGRSLWGSDFPWPANQPGYRTMLEATRSALPDLTSTERDLVFGGTISSLFPDHLTQTNDRQGES
jgi:L-fuconolactonase